MTIYLSKPLTNKDVKCKIGEEWFYNGKRHGLSVFVHQSTGMLQSIGILKQGWREGRTRFWYESGRRCKDLVYSEGKVQGSVTWWDSDGAKKATFLYINDNLQFNWREKTKRDFYALLEYMSIGYSYTATGKFVGEYSKSQFLEVLGKPDVDIGETQFTRSFGFRCADGVVVLSHVNMDPIRDVLRVFEEP
jgi:hypothetical protein